MMCNSACVARTEHRHNDRRGFFIQRLENSCATKQQNTYVSYSISADIYSAMGLDLRACLLRVVKFTVRHIECLDTYMKY